MAFLNKSFTTTLATTGTALLSLSFVFATTAQEVLGSCIFLFVKHPFDVLDRVDIGDEPLIVEHISLLFTVFKRVRDHKTTQVPNIVLNTVWIQNVSRSKAMREQLFMYIAFDTSLEDIQLLKDEMQAFVRDKENSRDFQPDVDLEITGIAEMNKLELRVEIRHKVYFSIPLQMLLSKIDLFLFRSPIGPTKLSVPPAAQNSCVPLSSPSAKSPSSPPVAPTPPWAPRTNQPTLFLSLTPKPRPPAPPLQKSKTANAWFLRKSPHPQSQTTALPPKSPIQQPRHRSVIAPQPS